MINFLEFFEDITSDLGAYGFVFDNYGVSCNLFYKKELPVTENYIKRTTSNDYYDLNTPDSEARIIIPSIYKFKSINYTALPIEESQEEAFILCDDAELMVKDTLISVDFSMLSRTKVEVYKVVDIPQIEGIYNRIVHKLLIEPYRYTTQVENG